MGDSVIESGELSGVDFTVRNREIKLERLFGFIVVERIPDEYRSRRCRVLISGLRYNEVVGFTHLVYLVKQNFDIICIIGGVKNKFDINRDFSGYVYYSNNFFFPNVPFERIEADGDNHIFKFVLVERKAKGKISHLIRYGRVLIGGFVKIHAFVFDERVENKRAKKRSKKEVVEVKNEVLGKKVSFSPALTNLGSRMVVSLEED